MATLKSLKHNPHFKEGFVRAMNNDFRLGAEKYNITERGKFVDFFYRRYVYFNPDIFSRERDRVEQLLRRDKQECEKRNGGYFGAEQKDMFMFFAKHRTGIITDETIERLRLVDKIDRYIQRVEKAKLLELQPRPSENKVRFSL